HQAAGDEQDVGPVPQQLRLPELEAVVVLVEHGGHLAAQQAGVGGPVGGGQLRDGLLDVDRVAGVHDGQVRCGAAGREHRVGGGEGAIGAAAVVTRDVPGNGVAGGHPAKVRGEL